MVQGCTVRALAAVSLQAWSTSGECQSSCRAGLVTTCLSRRRRCGTFCLDEDVGLWIERHGPNGRPVTGLPTPAPRIAISCCLVERMRLGKHGAVVPGVALCGSDVSDATVPMLIVVPVGKAHCPVPGGLQICKPTGGEVGSIFGRSEQRFGKGIVVADPRTRVGGLDAEPVQHGEHGGGLHCGAVVAVQHRFGGFGVHALGQGGAAGQMGGVLGVVAVMHLPADDLAAEQVQDEVQVEPSALQGGRQERHIPAPYVTGPGGGVRDRGSGRAGRTGAASAVHLAMGAQHAVEARLAGQVGAIVGQCGNDARRRHVGEAGFIGHGDDPRPLCLAQRVRWRGMPGIGSAICFGSTITGVLALHRADIQTGQVGRLRHPDRPNPFDHRLTLGCQHLDLPQHIDEANVQLTLLHGQPLLEMRTKSTKMR